VSDGRAESIDCDSNAGSDALCIAESENEYRSDVTSDGDGSRRSRKKHHKKCKKNKSGKLKHHREQNKAINDVLAGTLEGMEELFTSSNYRERITQCE
jgi:hypothetical protein